MNWIADPQIWISLLTLTFLEIVLGVDNVVFIAILASKLPAGEQDKARKLGLAFALVTRILLLCALSWLAGMTAPLFAVFSHPVSGKDLVLLFGGLFLIGKSTHEIHGSLEGCEPQEVAKKAGGKLLAVVAQIAVIDIVFSLDSVITAIGLAQHLWVMIAAVVAAMAIMLWLSGIIAKIVEKHPTLKILALSFLLLIGVVLVAEGTGQHVSKGYIYFAMAFSFTVELLNIKMRARHQPARLHSRVGE